MGNAQLSGVIQHLRRLAEPKHAGFLTDAQLLERFATDRDQAAFEVLVWRHGGMVLGLCRRMLRHAQDAEDAFQATFLALIRRAHAIRKRESVASWLHQVAYRAALGVKAQTVRRLPCDHAESSPVEANVETSRSDWWPALDEEISRLPDKYRVPVVLCYLQGKTLGETARELGHPPATVGTRLARARQRLRGRLIRRGVTLTTGTFSLALAESHATAGIPAGLVHSTINIAAAVTAGNGMASGLVSASVAALTKGVLRTMYVSKLRWAWSAGLLLGLVSASVMYLRSPAAADPPAAEKATQSQGLEAVADKVEQGPTVRGTLKSVDATKLTLTVLVMVDQTKKKIEEKTFEIAKDAKVLLPNASGDKNNVPTGRLTDLSEGIFVDLQLAVDKKTVTSISARGPTVQGNVTSVDPAKNTITITTKEATGPVDSTFALTKDAKVLLNDGLTKEDKDREAKLADLAKGTRVAVQLSVDRKTAMGIRVQGDVFSGSLKGIDNGNRTVTITFKGDGQVVEKTFNLAKNARMDGNLVAGSRVTVQLSVFDKTVAVAVRGE